jgi:acetyltransferase-like isoleucine patch superfamily enzyme
MSAIAPEHKPAPRSGGSFLRLFRPGVKLFGRFYRRWMQFTNLALSVSAPPPKGVVVGRGTYGIAEKTFYLPWGNEQVIIGKYCSIAADVEFIFGDHDMRRVSTFPFGLLSGAGGPDEPLYRGPVIVGNDVWIGRRSMIMANVTIGDGAVIAAGAVVTRNVEPYSVVGGVPARPIRKRFSDRQIAELLDIRWWDWPEEQILANPDLLRGDVDAFLASVCAEREGT